MTNHEVFVIVNGVIVAPVMAGGPSPQPIPRQYWVHCLLRDGDIVGGEVVPRNIVEQWPVTETAEIRGEQVLVPVIGEDGQRLTQPVVVGQTTPTVSGGVLTIFREALDDTPENALTEWEGGQHKVPIPEPARSRWMVPKLAVVERLEAASLRLAAKVALAQDDYQQDRWDAAAEIASDDQAVRALLADIGADPDAILARP